MRITIGLLVLMTVSRAAHADLVWSDAYKSPMSSWGAYMYDQNVKRHLYGRATKPATNQPTVPRAAISATDFRRSAKGKDVVAQFVSTLAAPQAAELATTLRATMAQLGTAGRKDNVANAMALAIALSFMVLDKHDFDGAKADELVLTVNDLLASSPQFAKLGGLARQEMHDSLLLTSAVIAVLANAGERETSQALARQLLKALVGITE